MLCMDGIPTELITGLQIHSSFWRCLFFCFVPWGKGFLKKGTDLHDGYYLLYTDFWDFGGFPLFPSDKVIMAVERMSGSIHGLDYHRVKEFAVRVRSVDEQVWCNIEVFIYDTGRYSPPPLTAGAISELSLPGMKARAPFFHVQQLQTNRERERDREKHDNFEDKLTVSFFQIGEERIGIS